MNKLKLLWALAFAAACTRALDNKLSVKGSAGVGVTELWPAATSDACKSVPHDVVAAANLTDKERAVLGDLCWQQPDQELLQLTTRDARPPGVQCNATTWCDNDGACSIVCQRGTVVVEPWLAKAIDTQVKLARRLPLCMATMLGTHNSGITMADGYGNLDLYFEQYLKWIKWAGNTHIQTNNQWLSLTDQLNLGVRNVELDTHWVEGDLRIAHCGGAHIQLFDKLIEAVNVVAKVLGAKIRWDTETFGCVPSLSSIPSGDQRTFVDALQELSAWLALPEHQQEFLVLFLDDQMDLKTWGLVGKLLDQILQVLPRESIFAPADLQALGSGWPSMDALVGQGRRVMFVSGTDYGDDMAPLIFSRGHPVCNWTEPALIQLEVEPACQVRRTAAAVQPMLSGRLLRTMTCELVYGPMNCDFIYRGINAPLLDEYSLPPLVACGLNMPCPDLLTPQRAASAIWTWAPGHPYNASPAPDHGDGGGGSRRWWTGLERAEQQPLLQWLAHVLRMVLGRLLSTDGEADGDQGSCSAIVAADGRWRAVPCGQVLPMACKRINGSGEPWLVQTAGALAGCPTGYSHSVPAHAQDNLHLQQVMQSQGVGQAWLPLKGPEWEV